MTHDPSVELDDIDRKILKILQVSGRDSASHIADSIGVSVPTVTDRVKKLQDSGVIKGFQATLDPHKIGLDVGAFITVISDSSAHYGDVTAAANANPDVIQCYSTTGRGSHILEIQTQNTRSLEKLLRTIQSWPGIIRTETQLILTSYKEKSLYPIPPSRNSRSG